MDLAEILALIQELGGNLISRYGAWGVAAAMLAESAGVPFISSVVLLTAGGMILSGRASFSALLLASTAGITLGSAIGYLIGYLGGSVGRVVGGYLNRNSGAAAPARSRAFAQVFAYMEKYGIYSILIGQLWGVTRTFISFPAGAMKMSLLRFILFTTLGGAVFSLWVIGWSLIFTGAAGLLLKLLKILHLFTPWIWPALILAVIIAAYLYYRYRKKTT
jgi:membrane protein DedA with SNARE-associated domain